MRQKNEKSKQDSEWIEKSQVVPATVSDTVHCREQIFDIVPQRENLEEFRFAKWSFNPSFIGNLQN